MCRVFLHLQTLMNVLLTMEDVFKSASTFQGAMLVLVMMIKSGCQKIKRVYQEVSGCLPGQECLSDSDTVMGLL